MNSQGLIVYDHQQINIYGVLLRTTIKPSKAKLMTTPKKEDSIETDPEC